MQFSLSASLAVLSYCAAVSSLALPDQDQGPSPIYGEHEHRVNKEHPHFAKRVYKPDPHEEIAYTVNYDSYWIWKDPPMCGINHGTRFNWIDEHYFEFRHPHSGKSRPTTQLAHIHLYAAERIDKIKMEWDDKVDGHIVGGMGGREVEHSPLNLVNNMYINGMQSGCCTKNHHSRLCFAKFTTNKDGEANTLVGGRRPAYWRTAKPACCKAISAYGASGAEVDSFQLYYLKLEDYNSFTEPMPGYPGQKGPGGPGIGRKAFEVSKRQTNKRAVSTNILGDHDTSAYSLIDHTPHVQDNFRVSRIVTYCSDRVEGIQLTYTNLHNPAEERVSEFHGRRVGQLREMDLTKGDYVHTVDNSNCGDPESGRSQVCGLVFHTYLMQQHACGQSTASGDSQSIAQHAMLSIQGAHEGEVLKSIGINWIPVEDHH